MNVPLLPSPAGTPSGAATPQSGSASPERPRRVIVLAGVVGTGKSTLSKALVAHLPGYARVCQDELGDRQACEEMARAYLAQGLSVIIDRQNFDKQQRSHWIQIARAAGVEVVAAILTTPYDECQRRLQVRTDHETIASPGVALDLLDRFSMSWRPPTANEGFDRIVRLPSNLPRIFDVARLEALVALIDASPKLARQQTLDGMFGRGGRTFAHPPAGGAWGSPGRRLGP